MAQKSLVLYLASQSSRRQEILDSMRIPFKVVPSHYRERWSRKKSPQELSVRHALGKVRKAVLPARARFVLGGDTIVWHDGHGLGKPKHRAEALRTLRRLAGKKHEVVTGLVLWDRKTGRILSGCSKTDVWMKAFGEDALADYIQKVHPYDKAGAYAIQGRPKIVRKIRGSYSNVVGLPRELLRKMLNQIFKGTDEGYTARFTGGLVE